MVRHTALAGLCVGGGNRLVESVGRCGNDGGPSIVWTARLVLSDFAFEVVFDFICFRVVFVSAEE